MPIGSIQCQTIEFISIISEHADLPFEEFLEALSYFLSVPALRVQCAADLVWLVAHLCRDGSRALAVSGIASLADLVSDILESYPRAIGGEEEDWDDSTEMLAVIDLVGALAVGLGGELPAWADAHLLLKALGAADAAAVQRAAELFAVLVRFPQLCALLRDSNIIAYLRLSVALCSFATTRIAIEIAAGLVNGATEPGLVRLVAGGCVDVLARGLEIDDSNVRVAAFGALEALMRSAGADPSARSIAIAECRRAGVLQSLDAVADDLTDAAEDLDAAARSFIALWAEMDPVD
jgi:hypothetical protein